MDEVVEQGFRPEIDETVGTLDRMVSELARVIRGKEPFLKQLVSCLVAGGHVLIDDVPGLGKTTVAKTLALLISRDEQDGDPVAFRRIQFTPDLLPYDITGVDVFDPKTREFVFTPGPVFANIVLADEINRSTPKVQSALLEVMAEHQVTVGSRTHAMDDLFLVLGTQNPVEIEGTYPLPLAQIDRFLMRLHIGYPDPEVELDILSSNPSESIMPHIRPVCSRREILSARSVSEAVYCDQRLMRAVVDIAAATRDHDAVEYGVSPRGSLMMLRAARAYALVRGRSYVIDQDIVDLAAPVFAHRIKLRDASVDPRQLVDGVAREHVKRAHR
ncbi:MAG: AAA family ATPase [Spirochaetaceae bacterium]